MSDEKIGAGWRVKVGSMMFVASMGWPLLLPILAFLGVSNTSIAAFTGVMVVAAEIMMLAGAAIAGKEGFALIKSKIFGLLKSYGPPKKVSRTRYSVGLVMFALPILLGWGAPYFGGHIPGFDEHPFAFAVAGDVLLLTSLFVLGGDFWDKLRSLFLHDATAVIPGKPVAHVS